MARFFRRGKSKIRFSPSLASPTAMTRAEITSSTDLTPQIAEVSGFSFSNSPISVPDMNSTFTSTISGEDTAEDSSLTFYDDDASSTLRTLLVKGTKGYIILMPYGDVSTKRAEIWPIESTGVADEWSAGNDPARYTVAFGITNTPALNATIPV